MCVLRLFVLLLVCVAPLGAAERDFVKTFPAGETVAVDVETFRGALIVTESERPEVRIATRVEIGAQDDAEVEQLMDGFSFEATQAGDRVTVRVLHLKQSGARFVWNEERQVVPTLRITVPARCDLTLKTGNGAITVGNISGRHRVENDAGDVFLRTVGGDVEVRTNTGDVVVSRCLGALRIRLGQGMIRVGTVAGECELTNRSGEIELQAPKARFKVYAEAGGVQVGIPRDFSGPGDVRTSGGAIVAQVDPAASVRVEAKTSILAKVQSQIPLTVEAGAVGSRRLTATQKDGRAQLSLRASGGEVRLMAREPGFE